MNVPPLCSSDAAAAAAAATRTCLKKAKSRNNILVQDRDDEVVGRRAVIRRACSKVRAAFAIKRARSNNNNNNSTPTKVAGVRRSLDHISASNVARKVHAIVPAQCLDNLGWSDNDDEDDDDVDDDIDKNENNNNSNKDQSLFPMKPRLTHDTAAAAPCPKRRRKIQFAEQVHVQFIQPHRDYSVEEKSSMWRNSWELSLLAQRNVREWFFEQQDWRNACEEESMLQDPISGQLLHPAHATTTAATTVMEQMRCQRLKQTNEEEKDEHRNNNNNSSNVNGIIDNNNNRNSAVTSQPPHRSNACVVGDLLDLAGEQTSHRNHDNDTSVIRQSFSSCLEGDLLGLEEDEFDNDPLVSIAKFDAFHATVVVDLEGAV